MWCPVCHFPDEKRTLGTYSIYPASKYARYSHAPGRGWPPMCRYYGFDFEVVHPVGFYPSRTQRGNMQWM